MYECQYSADGTKQQYKGSPKRSRSGSLFQMTYRSTVWFDAVSHHSTLRRSPTPCFPRIALLPTCVNDSVVDTLKFDLTWLDADDDPLVSTEGDHSPLHHIRTFGGTKDADVEDNGRGDEVPDVWPASTKVRAQRRSLCSGSSRGIGG